MARQTYAHASENSKAFHDWSNIILCFTSMGGILGGLLYLAVALLENINPLTSLFFWLLVFTCTVSFAWVWYNGRYYYEWSAPSYRSYGAHFPVSGRTRSEFPIIGNPFFVGTVHRILDELEVKTPDVYRQVLASLPKAEHDTSILPNLGRSDGLIALDGTGDYNQFRFVLLHEAFHCILCTTNEQIVNDKVNAVIQRLG